MKRVIKIIIIALVIILGYSELSKTLAYYNADVGLTNVFETEKYKFSINATGGSFNKDRVIIEGKKVSLPTPIRKGYTFLGFSSTNNGKVEYTNYIDDVKLINNKNIFAKWNVITYQISYDLDGGSIVGQPISYNVEDSITLPTPNKRGYEFLGWTGTELNATSKNVVIPKGSIGNRSYKANWKVRSYKIDYKLNGGTLNNSMTSYNVETNSFTLGTPTKTGYDFLGWTGSNGSQANKTITINKGTIGNLSYNANWKVRSYTVTYQNANGSHYSSQTVDYNADVPLVGYGVDQVHVFSGWLFNGNIVNNLKMPNNNITLVASVREVNCYLVTGQATDGDESRAYKFAELVSHKGLGGRVQWGGLGMEFVSNTSNYSHVKDAANYLMANAPKNSWPYLRWLAISCENGYSEQLR